MQLRSCECEWLLRSKCMNVKALTFTNADMCSYT